MIFNVRLMKLIFLLHIFYFERFCPCFGKYLICSYLSIWKYFQIDKYEQIKYFLKDRKTLSKGKIRNNKISFNNLYIKYLYSKTFVFPILKNDCYTKTSFCQTNLYTARNTPTNILKKSPIFLAQRSLHSGFENVV